MGSSTRLVVLRMPPKFHHNTFLHSFTNPLHLSCFLFSRHVIFFLQTIFTSCDNAGFFSLRLESGSFFYIQFEASFSYVIVQINAHYWPEQQCRVYLDHPVL
jgi:hypothetical protein